jgi:hypothetical protein
MIELVDGVIDLNLRDLQKVTALGEVLRSKRRDSGLAHLFTASWINRDCPSALNPLGLR